MFFASVLSLKCPFWAGLVQKMKIVSFGWNLIHSLTQWRTQWWCSLFLFLNDTPFYGKFVSKNENCLLKLKFRIQTNLNVQNSMVMFFFSFLDLFAQVLSKKSIWHFDVTWLISQQVINFKIILKCKHFLLNVTQFFTYKIQVDSFDWTFHLTLNW